MCLPPLCEGVLWPVPAWVWRDVQYFPCPFPCIVGNCRCHVAAVKSMCASPREGRPQSRACLPSAAIASPLCGWTTAGAGFDKAQPRPGRTQLGTQLGTQLSCLAVCRSVVFVCGCVGMAFGFVSLGQHCVLQLSPAGLIVVLVPGCCWAYSIFSV